MQETSILTTKPSRHSISSVIRAGWKAAHWFKENPRYTPTMDDLHSLRDAIKELEFATKVLDEVYTEVQIKYNQEINTKSEVYFESKG